uniref:Uncharacterized protein n=1 Tax=Micrurus lemniscatus lemniscatus TaxID=129467 RepID=A0A2D4IPI0_MICLE
MGGLHEETLCPHEEMSTYPPEMMATVLKTVTQAEIIQVPETPEIMPRHQGIMPIVIMDTPAHGMSILQEVTVIPPTAIGMATEGVTGITQTIPVEALTEIPMRVTVSGDFEGFLGLSY